jgi:hypothetical protein
MSRRNFTFSPRHDKMLVELARKLDISMVETVQRSLELLEEKEAKREKEIKLS